MRFISGLKRSTHAYGPKTSVKTNSADHALASCQRCEGFLTLNVLIFTAELQDAAELLDNAWRAGVDALIVQDLGLCLLAQQLVLSWVCMRPPRCPSPAPPVWLRPPPPAANGW